MGVVGDKPMTKTEVRAYLKRIREGAAWAERALAEPDTEPLLAAMQEIAGSAAHIQGALEQDYFPYVAQGVRGMDQRGR
jgi:hypothetical protein